MPYSQDLFHELNVLVHYNLSTSQEGIKVHASASPELIEATRRLFDKGLVTQTDGGYLTALGREAAEHAQVLLALIKAA